MEFIHVIECLEKGNYHIIDETIINTIYKHYNNDINILTYYCNLCDYDMFVNIINHCINNNIIIHLTNNYETNIIYQIISLQLIDYFTFIINKIITYKNIFQNVNINIINETQIININQTIKINIIGNMNILHLTIENNNITLLHEIINNLELLLSNNIITIHDIQSLLTQQNNYKLNPITYSKYLYIYNRIKLKSPNRNIYNILDSYYTKYTLSNLDDKYILFSNKGINSSINIDSMFHNDKSYDINCYNKFKDLKTYYNNLIISINEKTKKVIKYNT